ncbi:MAG: CofH family radical SAM protein [Planctomycetaceae bacterium]|jgi:aminodeoxyfutalosine synthase|nr:CofH family radical SAM protein [Planctomycetaceae bacterium]
MFERLDKIQERALTGEKISREDALFLFEPQTELEAVREIADSLRRSQHGDYVYYNVNAHLNPTNICKLRCPLCAFSCDSHEEQAYVLSGEEMLQTAKEAALHGATEIHIVGGIHPEKPYAWYRGILEKIHAAVPQLQLKAWTAIEIDHFAKLCRQTYEEVLHDLISVGLSGLPGGGAEIFDPEIRQKIAPEKGSFEIWRNVHRAAHSIGLPTNATMLFGHLESPRHRVDHLLTLYDLQQESLRQNRPARFEAFVPLVFHPYRTQLAGLKPISPDEILRTVAVSRILLSNIPHVKAYWVSLGLEFARMALRFGADDFDGTVRQEKVHHAAGSKTPVGLDAEQIRQCILAVHRVPVERDSHYQIRSRAT